MTAEQLALTAADGTRVTVHSWRPDGPVRGVVVLAHGMAEHAGRYDRLASSLTGAGWAVLAPDHRGHGRTADEGMLGHLGDEDGWARVVDDLRGVVALSREEHPGVPVVLLGHSMGSLLARTYVLDGGCDLDGLVLSGTAGDPGMARRAGLAVARAERWLCGPRHRSRLMDRLTFGSFNKPFEPTRTDFDWLSRDPAEVDAYVADPRCGQVCTTAFFVDMLGAMGPINDPTAVAAVRPDLPVLLLAGDADPVGGAGAGVRRVAELLTEAGVRDVSLRLYPQARHEVFNETNRDEVTTDLLAWLGQHVPAGG